MLLHASITGLQGVCSPNCVKVPSVTAVSRTMNTAIGPALPALLAFAGKEGQQEQQRQSRRREPIKQ